MKKTLVLEQSTNTHKLEGDIGKVIKFENGDVYYECAGGVVSHGEHGIIVNEKACLKINQQEYNPVTKSLQNAFD